MEFLSRHSQWVIIMTLAIFGLLVIDIYYLEGFFILAFVIDNFVKLLLLSFHSFVNHLANCAKNKFRILFNYFLCRAVFKFSADAK